MKKYLVKYIEATQIRTHIFKSPTLKYLLTVLDDCDIDENNIILIEKLI